MSNAPAQSDESRPIHVLLAGPDLARSVGGVRTHAVNFIEAFQADQTVRIEYFATSLGLYRAESSIAKIWRLIKNLWPFWRAARRQDVVHLNASFGLAPMVRDSFYVFVAVLLARRPVILQFHGGLPTGIPQLRSGLLRWLIRQALDRCSRLLVLSHPQQRDFQAVFPDIECVVVPNYVQVPDFPPRQPGISLVRFLFIARLDESKGVRDIVATARRLREDGRAFQVLFCGTGELDDWLKAQLRDSLFDDCLEYVGRVEGADKVRAFESSHVLLLPTRHREGFPYGILEAFSYRMPVIATTIGAIPDIVEAGQDGFLLEDNIRDSLVHCMSSLIQSPAEILRLGENARRKVEQKYSFDELRRRFTNVYAQAAGD